MRKGIKNGITAVAVGGAALLLLGSGSAVAQSQVTSDDIKDGTILRKDLSPNHVMFDIDNVFHSELSDRLFYDLNNVFSHEIANGTIKSEDISDEAKAELKGPKGDKGDKGDPGADGTDGADGADGVSGYEVIGQEIVLPAGETLTRVQPCPEGKVSTGGGYKIDDPFSVVVFHSMPAGLTETADGTWESTGWEIKLRNKGTSKTNVTAFANCAAAS